MDFQKEFEDLKKLWSERTTTGKVILIFAFGLSAMSVGSIADTVFEFKGFIVNGIEFYRAITEPSREFLNSFFKFEIDESEKDFIILIILSLSSIYKSKNISSSGLKLRRFSGYLIRLYICLTFFVLFNLTVYLFNLSIYISNVVQVILLAGIPTIPVIISWMIYDSNKIDKRAKFAFFYMLALYVFIAIIAAISEGLMRPMT